VSTTGTPQRPLAHGSPQACPYVPRHPVRIPTGGHTVTYPALAHDLHGQGREAAESLVFYTSPRPASMLPIM